MTADPLSSPPARDAAESPLTDDDAPTPAAPLGAGPSDEPELPFTD